MTDLIERIRQVIDYHSAEDHGGDAGVTCGCGATGLGDHSRHVAEEIVNQLGLTPKHVGNVEKQIRNVSALVDDELTKLEGAE
ncbi:MAG TPA: hypothetical protein VMB04_20175 [Mycobacterium sp.]|nr:hypothetical protein [Mycobacterium sp.]